ncbi:O-antigen polymerase [Streptococcus zalophi]|uniref:Oligosaccharide repeat unit polymerase n=1 Tax=Streptococcus zalophi TaxID=640031 RepID=A0A934UD25_9STRE|nr:O-antigen polymerase [Streptococcus zalophi]MBJ8349335.1 oligosaccharide repeat unit polymerase [Streptococcus zalophi]
MIQIYATILAFFILLMFLFSFYFDDDLLSPSKLFLILEFIRYVPGLFLLEEESSILFTEPLTFKLLIYEIIFIISTLVAIYLFMGKKINNKKVYKDIPMSSIFIFYFIGFLAKIIVFNKLGGVSNIMSNPQLAYQLQSHGFGIYNIFYKFMVIAILALTDKYLHYKKLNYLVILVLMVSFYVFSFLVYTNRTPALILFLILLFIYHFKVRKFKIYDAVNPRVLMVGLLIVFLSFSASQKRVQNSGTIETSRIFDIVRNLSYDGRDMFVYEKFSEEPKLYGRGYLNIIPSVIPGKIDKPPIDDGLYLVNYIRGYNVSINTNSNMLPSRTGSVPFSTPSYLYANFGILGIIVGGFVLGYIYILSYKYMQDYFDSFSISIYFYIIYSFGFSTGKLVPVLITIITTLVLKKIISLKIVIK